MGVSHSTELKPRPIGTPKWRKSHHSAAPTTPAAPVPDANQLTPGCPLYLVVSCKKVISPRPEDALANEMPKSLSGTEEKMTMTCKRGKEPVTMYEPFYY